MGANRQTRWLLFFRNNTLTVQANNVARLGSHLTLGTGWHRFTGIGICGTIRVSRG